MTSQQQSSISLIQYTEPYKPFLDDYHLPEEQLMFTMLPIEKIHNPKVTSTSSHVLILDGDRPVGYFTLEDGAKLQKYSDNPRARVLTSFSIESTFQGKGLAKDALTLLPSFVHEELPEVNEIVLGVNQKNVAALNLYIKMGFMDEGEIFEGAKGPQHVLHLYL
ncbi:GNAT family N-acetyltransferase [Alkalibacillus salilacus]|nr:GNAT family protein [Alkalibacillus salilacus]